jgi:hypothetical protein
MKMYSFKVNEDGAFTRIEKLAVPIHEDEVDSWDREYTYFTTFAQAKAAVVKYLKVRLDDYKSAMKRVRIQKTPYE